MSVFYPHGYLYRTNEFIPRIPVYRKIPVYVLINMFAPSRHFSQCLNLSKDKATSLVWNYFGFEAGEDGKPINSEKAICRIASECRKKPVLAKGGNTSNLLTHLKRHHHKQYAELIEAQEKKKSKENSLKASQGQTKLKAVEQSAAKYFCGSKK